MPLEEPDIYIYAESMTKEKGFADLIIGVGISKRVVKIMDVKQKGKRRHRRSGLRQILDIVWGGIRTRRSGGVKS